MEEHALIKLIDLAGLRMIAYQVDEIDGIPIYKEYVLAKSDPNEMIPPSMAAIELFAKLVARHVTK
ncbi:hypothetical protein [Limnohabitans sp.]|uniref:hypothetical protein n=1 Tax=Limnohabitans sp. TaxID=1907725 RepID=UPI0033417576